jgi:putative oxidoreductase
MIHRLQALAPQMLGILRIVAALLFMAHGTQKLLGFPASDFSPSVGSLMWFAGLIELVGGALVLVGFQTRIARVKPPSAGSRSTATRSTTRAPS